MQIGAHQIWEENHENGSETGPYGSVRADIHTGWILQALGSLWDASRVSKRFWKTKENTTNGMKQVHMGPFRTTMAQDCSHRLWEASGMPPGP